MGSPSSSDPFLVLGVSQNAGESEVRARYLELVKQFPPEREPEKFREIRAAYEAAKDPFTIARRLLRQPVDDIPQWSEILEREKRNPPRLTPAFVLSLGNRASGNSAATPSSSDTTGLPD